MTTYGKIENDKLIPAYNGYNGTIGLADSSELCEANGFTAYTEEEISGYFAGTHQIIDGVLTDISETAEYIARQEQKEQKRIASMTMTALDFIQVLKNAGLTSKQIKEYLDVNIELDMQLKYCQNVYCGVVCQLCPLTIEGVTITQEMVIKAFKIKNNEEV